MPNDEITVGVVSETPAPDAGLSDEAILDQAIAANSQGSGDEPDIQTDAVDGEDPVDAALKDEESGAKDDEGAQGEPDNKPDAEHQNGDASKDGEAPDDEDDFTGNLTVHALNSRIAKDPALKAVIEKDPGFKNQLFHTARRADRADKYDELFQTPALAAETKAAADLEYAQRELYEGEDSEKFLQSLIGRSYERDEQGRVKLDANNQPISNGAYDRHMSFYRNAWYSNVEAAASNIPDGTMINVGDNSYSKADIIEAVQILKAVTEGSSAKAEAQPSKDLPKEVQDQLAELERLKASRKSEDAQSLETFKGNIETERQAALTASVKAMLATKLPKDNALTDYFKDKVVEDTVKRIQALADKNRAHQDVVSRAIKGASRNPEGVAKIVAIHNAYAKDLMARELAQVLSKAAPAVVAAAGAARSRVNQQTNRREVQASGGVSTPSRPDAKQLARTIDADARKSGKQLSDEEYLDRVIAAQQRG